jgi:hypothetical protein
MIFRRLGRSKRQHIKSCLWSYGHLHSQVGVQSHDVFKRKVLDVREKIMMVLLKNIAPGSYESQGSDLKNKK